LDTAINWGRYSELFDFDASRRRFYLPEAEASLVATESGA
jgi:NitT/TauT family transport system ATP-binding protein